MLYMIVAAIAGIVLIHVIHALTLDRIIRYEEIPFCSQNLASELNGYRVAFISDVHLISESRLRNVVDELNRRGLDLLVLGGDYATITNIMQKRVDIMQKSLEILSEIKTTDGIYGVEGNHDNHIYLFETMRTLGMTPLSNNGYHIREGLYLAGLEDLWNRIPNVSQATADSLPEDFVLLISHNPDATMLQDTKGVDLILCGHTHGGQISFFGFWAPFFALTKSVTTYGQRFRSGWSRSLAGTPLFVSRGLGEYTPRVFASPQVIIITLYTK